MTEQTDARETPVQGGYVTLRGERFYQIRHSDALEPFFISLVSGSDHWLFIASTGGLTAGRGSADHALFPYYTEDKVSASSEHTGAKTLLRVRRAGAAHLWEPFSIRQAGQYRVERNLYKNIEGTALVFEELNLDLALNYQYAWRFSDTYGFIKTSWLANHGAAGQVEVLDGLQNLLPANVTAQTQNTFSCLLDAYKRSELEPSTGLGLFSLSSTLTDLAEPSESLLATTVAAVGLPASTHLLSTQQIDRFRQGQPLSTETEIRGRPGAYFARATLDLASGAEHTWHLVADVDQDSAAIVQRLSELRGDPQALIEHLERDLDASTTALREKVARADGLQLSGDALGTSHHFANVLFNIMRGGVFASDGALDTADLAAFIAVRNRAVRAAQAGWLAALPARLPLADLLARLEAQPDPDLLRLGYAYLPLTFSRRHGDPSRPWNRFAINLKNPDGSPRLDYEGNWRDIFQNWEALAYAYPEFVESMISIFLSATTADGYNPYRLSRQGLDWEVPEPGNPWANIGYWSDHQIIYLLKLMEISVRFHPGKLHTFLRRPLFSYARVPYRLRPYADLLQNPYTTIDFDWDLERVVEARVREVGADGKLVPAPDGQIFHAALAEKLLTLLLAKLANLVPEGGLWMNTQRPEWNDANNALVGKGLSVVTLGYLRRYIVFVRELLAGAGAGDLPVSAEVLDWGRATAAILTRFLPALAQPMDDAGRRAVMDALGQAGSRYRAQFYAQSLSGNVAPLPPAELDTWLALALRYVEHTLRANRRDDGLYHAYNTLALTAGRATLHRLPEMLEGQVSILSSGLLTNAETLALLNALRASALYRADQQSYILYPDRALPAFWEKNTLAAAQVQDLKLVAALTQAGDRRLLSPDRDGHYHFHGQFRNVTDVDRVLTHLAAEPHYAALVSAEAPAVRALFEATFQHQAFTGRSGTFFAYEGLGSIYWHMVTKLLLAVEETAWHAAAAPEGPALRAAYRAIRAGLGFNKSPAVYGAFPTDPYSHTPKGQGARQPGMTGMVKEEILTRLAELGLCVEGGQIRFDFRLFDASEALAEPATFAWLDVAGQPQHMALPAGALAYTFCQVPIVVQPGADAGLTVYLAGGRALPVAGHRLEAEYSAHIFRRDGMVQGLTVTLGTER